MIEGQEPSRSTQPRDYGGFENYREQARYAGGTQRVWIFLCTVLVIAFPIAAAMMASRMKFSGGALVLTFCVAMVVSIWLLATKHLKGKARLVIFVTMAVASLTVFFT